jgi:hypothetical protein
MAPLKPLDFKYKALFGSEFSTPILEQSPLQAHVKVIGLANLFHQKILLLQISKIWNTFCFKLKILFLNKQNMNLKKILRQLGSMVVMG